MVVVEDLCFSAPREQELDSQSEVMPPTPHGEPRGFMVTKYRLSLFRV